MTSDAKQTAGQDRIRLVTDLAEQPFAHISLSDPGGRETRVCREAGRGLSWPRLVRIADIDATQQPEQPF